MEEKIHRNLVVTLFIALFFLTKAQALVVCEQLGIDLPTYLRMCVTRLVRENGIPFSMKLEESRGLAAMKAASRIAEQNGNSEMTLDEINAEIAEARK